MRRMRNEIETNQISRIPIKLPKNTNLDEITTEGLYKVSNYSIDGVSYDGTLEVIKWDSHYFRQIFYTIDNGDPNPIFTRVRVNLTHPYKEWQVMDNSQTNINVIINSPISSAYTESSSAYKKLLIQNNRLICVIETEMVFNDIRDAKNVSFQTGSIPDYIAKKIQRKDGTNLTTTSSKKDITRVFGVVSVGEAEYSKGEIKPALVYSGSKNLFYISINTPETLSLSNNKLSISIRFELEL